MQIFPVSTKLLLLLLPSGRDLPVSLGMRYTQLGSSNSQQYHLGFVFLWNSMPFSFSLFFHLKALKFHSSLLTLKMLLYELW